MSASTLCQKRTRKQLGIFIKILLVAGATTLYFHNPTNMIDRCCVQLGLQPPHLNTKFQAKFQTTATQNKPNIAIQNPPNLTVLTSSPNGEIVSGRAISLPTNNTSPVDANNTVATTNPSDVGQNNGTANNNVQPLSTGSNSSNTSTMPQNTSTVLQNTSTAAGISTATKAPIVSPTTNSPNKPPATTNLSSNKPQPRMDTSIEIINTQERKFLVRITLVNPTAETCQTSSAYLTLPSGIKVEQIQDFKRTTSSDIIICQFDPVVGGEKQNKECMLVATKSGEFNILIKKYFKSVQYKSTEEKIKF